MTKTEKRFSFVILTLAILIALMSGDAFAQGQAKPPTGGPRLSLDGYLEQVARQNDAYRSSELAEEGADLRTNEWTLLTAPSLFANATYANDQREAASSLSPTKTIVQSYSLGVQQQTSFGLQSRLYYNYTFTDLTYGSTAGLPAGFLPQPEFGTAGPVLELTQSFGRNGFGRETRANQTLLSAQSKATKYSENFRQSQLLAEAESAFWRLALAREAVDLTKENLERAKRVRQLSARRTRTGLSDRADLLQSDAALYSRQLELQNAIDEEKVTARVFNTLRGVAADVVEESLPMLDRDLISGLKLPEKKELRDDVKAAAERRRLAEANAQLGIERNRPVIDAFATMGLNGRDAVTGTTISESFETDHPNYSVGVRVTVPLDLKTLEQDRQGYNREQLAAETAYRRTVFENERLWNDLTKRFIETQERFALARKIETAQREKLDYERDRLNRGRSTTFQVIQFEQDNAIAQLARIRLQAEVLNIHAQLKTFGGGQ